nr:PREDICTED: uncharacterized protein LOC109447757 [Rhinolophus sinicus]
MAVSLRDRKGAAAATQTASRPGFSFSGFFFPRLLLRCTGLPWRVPGSVWLGTSGPCLRSLSRRRSGSLREAPRAVTRAKSGPGGGCWERGAGGGPAAAQALPRAQGGEGRERRAQRRGGSSAGTARIFWRAKRGSAARCFSGTVRIQLACGCAFAAHFLLLSGSGDELPLGQGKERQPPPRPLRTFSLCREVGYAENAWSGLPAAPPKIPRALGARPVRLSGAALGGVSGRAWGVGRRGRAEAPGRFRRRRKDGGAPEPLHSSSAWSGASPTPWPWLR